MAIHPRIYLDNAATSWPKPEAVYQAIDRYHRTCGAPAGRGVYAQAVEVQRAVDATRAALARLIGARTPQSVIFTSGGTDSLNLALHGSWREFGHVITSVAEHNSVLRPLKTLEDAGRIAVSRVPCDGQGLVDPAAIEAAWRPDTRLVAITHASNVTGALQSVADIGVVVRQREALLLVDAAQTLGEVPIDVETLGVDLLAGSGHKGLLGPLGTGLLYLRPGVENLVAPVRQGGTGSDSQFDRQPDRLPDKYESGNLNVPGILGLQAGAEYLMQQGIDQVRQRSVVLTARLMQGLSSVEHVRLPGPSDARRRVGIVSVIVEGQDPAELAILLDMLYGVQARPGLHCAPAMHRALGTLDRGGMLRFSVGCFNREEDVDRAVEGLRAVASAQQSV